MNEVEPAAIDGIANFAAFFGAAGLGFVLGWTLYFANRGKSGNLSTSDLAAIAGVVAGGAVAALIGDIVEDRSSKAIIFGGYGIGLIVGFLSYFWALRRALRSDHGDAALESILRSPMFQGQEPLALEPKQVRPGPMRQRTAESAAIMAELEACLAAADALAMDLAHAAMNEDDLDKKAEIKAAIRKLDMFRREINIQIAIGHLTSSEIVAFLSIVERETDKLNTEADRLRQAANNLQKVSDLLSASETLIGSLKKFVG